MKKKITCSDCKKPFPAKQIARRGKGWAYCRGCFAKWLKAKTGHDVLDGQYKAALALDRNRRMIESSSPSGTRSQKQSEWRLR